MLGVLQEEKTAEHTMLSTSVKRAEDDLTVARRKHQEYTKESGELQEKIAGLALESDTTLRRCVARAGRESSRRNSVHSTPAGCSLAWLGLGTRLSVKAVVREKEDRLVAHDVLRLEVKKLKDLLSVSSPTAQLVYPRSLPALILLIPIRYRF